MKKYQIYNFKIRVEHEHVGDESTKKNVGKTKIDRIGSEKIRESCGIQPINKWMERRR